MRAAGLTALGIVLGALAGIVLRLEAVILGLEARMLLWGIIGAGIGGYIGYVRGTRRKRKT